MPSLPSLQKRYDRALSEGDFYAAEQACRMMYHRLTQPPQDLSRALQVVHTAAASLLQRRQIHAGAALCQLLVKHLVDHTVRVHDTLISDLRSLAAAFDHATDTDDHQQEREAWVEKLRWLKAAVAWSARADCAGFQQGHPALNALAGEAAVQVGDVELAQRLFVRSDEPDKFAEFLHGHAQQVLESERALVLTRAVLRYLVTENVGDAAVVRRKFAMLADWKTVEGKGGGNVEAPPLGNFCELLVELCQRERAAGEVFKKAVEAYGSELKRDEGVEAMVTAVGAKYFGIQPPQQGGLGMMMNSMLRGMMNS